MQFKTSITEIEDGHEIIRGHKLEDLVGKHTFAESIFLILRGELPNNHEARMLDAIFTSIIDHGPAVASALNARVSASAKNSTHTALAAGILGLGPRHGIAIEGAMKFFYENLEEQDLATLLKSLKEKKVRIPGYGHKIFSVDPRAEMLFGVAREENIAGKHVAFAEAVHKGINEISSKQLPINCDGAIAAILCDMKFDVRLGQAMFIIGRVPGLLAHIAEEQMNDVGIRRLDNEDVDFTA